MPPKKAAPTAAQRAAARARRRTKSRASSTGRALRASRAPARRSVTSLARRRAADKAGVPLRRVSASQLGSARDHLVKSTRSVVLKPKRGSQFYAAPAKGGARLAPSDVRRQSPYAVRRRTVKAAPKSIACASSRKRPTLLASGRVACRKPTLNGWARATRLAYKKGLIMSVGDLADKSTRLEVYQMGLDAGYKGLSQAGLARMKAGPARRRPAAKKPAARKPAAKKPAVRRRSARLASR